MALRAKARKLIALPASDRRLLLRAAIVLAGCRLAVWLLPLPLLSRWLPVITLPPRHATAGINDEKLAWAIAATGPSLGATCLPQAMAACWFLARSGMQPILRIGVRKSGEGAVSAHAWVEHAGRVLIGGRPDLASYAPLLSVGPGSGTITRFSAANS